MVSKFIWVRDRDKIEHYINVDHIVRVTNIQAHGVYSAAAYLVLTDKTLFLSQEDFDTYQDVITKIQAAV
jgi:hypothetical protein